MSIAISAVPNIFFLIFDFSLIFLHVLVHPPRPLSSCYAVPVPSSSHSNGTENSHLPTLRRRIARASTGPGVYRWKDQEGTVLYVGKAKNLRNRLRSYVAPDAGKDQGPWKQSLFRQIADFDVTVVNSELEALVLETNLIKQLRPKYNVLMKDDKNYVYVEVTLQDAYPRVAVVRRMADPKAKYFGPYLSAYHTRQSLDMLHLLFPFFACKPSLDALNRAEGDSEVVYNTGKLKPCLDYQIGRCCGLCAGAVSREEYRKRIDAVLAFFRGNYDPVIRRAKEQMMEAAAERRFERAKDLRDMLQSVEELKGKQIVSDTSGENADVIGMALLSGKVQVVLMRKREGKLIDEESFTLMGRAESVPEVLEQFLPQFYENLADLPEIILVAEEFSGRETVEQFLSERHGRKVSVRIPERGAKSHLLQLAERNAQEKAKQFEASWEAEERNLEEALSELARTLDLSAPPKRIEGYDISHTGGTETVGSMVVFIDGKPKNDQYRSFTIRSMQRGAVDDYRALQEVLTRRLRHLVGGLAFEEAQWKEGGITVGKARKADAETIRAIVERHADVLSDRDLDYQTFIVARHEEDIIGFARLREHSGKLLELSSVWVDEPFRGNHLASFLIRKLLQSVKKGKVYVHAIPEGIERYYETMGFRHLLKTPAVFQERWERYRQEHPDAMERPVLVYDAQQHKPDASLSTVPDLLVIDGGKGQLSAVVDVLRRFDLSIPVIGLAKREEEVFVPGRSTSILFPRDSQGKFLLMRLRDEAHRFANRHRRTRASKTLTASALDRVPSIGPLTRRKLLKEFGSVDAIRRAPDAALKQVLSEEQIRGMREVL